MRSSRDKPKKLCFNGDCAVKEEIGYDVNICDARCVYIEASYPNFTAQKQIELIKLIADKGMISFYRMKIESAEYCANWRKHSLVYEKDFSEALASLALQLIETGELDKNEVRKVLE